mgnify:CR=1 FL=1
MKQLLIAATLIFLSACASTEFKAYEGNNKTFTGNGGTKTTVNGIDIWDTGSPPRKFIVLGIIDDRRGSGPIPMYQLNSDIAKKVIEAGGDAAIQISSDTKITGYITNNNTTAYAFGNSVSAYGSGTISPVRKNYTRFAVIKYEP